MDYLEICEELAASYACLPQVILRLPWTQVSELWTIYTKRQRREIKYQATLHATAGMMQGLSVFTGGSETASESVSAGDNVTRMAALGFPVKQIKKE